MGIVPADRLRLNLVELLSGLKSFPPETVGRARDFLQQLTREFSQEEVDLATSGIKANMPSEQRDQLSKIYAQAVINHFAQETMRRLPR